MHRALFLSLLGAFLVVLGCDRKSNTAASKPAAGDKMIRVGATQEDGPTVPFTITAVYPHHAPSPKPPFHAPGGDWTFFDCIFPSVADGRIPFTIGVKTFPNDKNADTPIAWGSVTITTPDRNAADRFLKHLAAGMHTPYPPLRQPAPLEPTVFRTAVLGENIRRGSEGGFSDQAGGWSATKWFAQLDGIEGEIFFNYNLTDRKGEFSEKDADYNSDVLAALAVVLRDGPRPLRTPQTDPNLTENGPRLGPFQPIPNSRDDTPTFTPTSRLLLITHNTGTGPGILYTAAPDAPASQTQIARVEGNLSQVITNDPDARLLVLEETLRKSANTWSGSDPVHLWLVDRTANTRRPLTGPWSDKGTLSSDHALSPDSRYIAIRASQGTADSGTLLHFLNLRTNVTTTASIPGEVVNLLGWTTDQGTRAILRTGPLFEHDKASNYYQFDPAAAALTKLAAANLPPHTDPTISPDAKLQFILHPNQSLTIIDRATHTQRAFTFHEDDQRFAEEFSCRWLTPRYIHFEQSPRPAVIDARTLKMSYLSPNLKDHLTFSPDFTWALRSTETTEEIAPILPPRNAD